MKISKIAQLCKKRQTVAMFATEAGLWVGDGSSMYLLPEFCDISADGLALAFGISAQNEKIRFYRLEDMEKSYDLHDLTERGESICEQIDLVLWIGEDKIRPYKTEAGILFLKASRLAPLKEELENGEVYLRYETNGQPYFAVKCGMILCAIITPMQMLSEGFMERLEDLRDLCRVQYQNEKAKQLAAETQIKMSEAAGEED